MSHGFDTLKMQAGYHVSEHNYVVSVPTYQITVLVLGDSYHANRLFFFSESDPIYTRFSNPIVDVLEKCAAVLYGVSDVITLASGMITVSYALLSTAGKGGRILTTARPHGRTVDSLGHLFPELGVEIDFVENPDRIEEFEEKLAPDTKVTLIESLTNPFATIPDFEAVTRIAHAYGILLIIDSTVATPYLFNSLEHGADIVVYSAAKVFSGHGNVITGLALESGIFDYGNRNYSHSEKSPWLLRDEHDEPRSILQVFLQNPFTGRLRAIRLNYFGAALSPFDAYLMLTDPEILSERVAKQAPNTLVILEYLEQNEHVLWMRYPYAQGNKYRALAGCYFPKGMGPILSFGLRDTEEQKRALLASVKVFGYQANIGDARLPVINPAQTTHVELTEEQRLPVGLEISAICLSLELEGPKDLIEDLQQTFDSVSQD